MAHVLLPELKLTRRHGLSSGIMDAGVVQQRDQGTPQGG
jgi:hypothetical protein